MPKEILLTLALFGSTAWAVTIDAVYFGQTHVLKANNPYFGLVGERDGNGFALIHGVAVEDDMAMLKLLLKAGAEVNDISGGGDWPLKDACQSGNADAVAFLLQSGANPNLTSTGETALFAAVSGGSLECVRLLLDAGADVNATDCDGWTCLFHLRSEAVAH